MKFFELNIFLYEDYKLFKRMFLFVSIISLNYYSAYQFNNIGELIKNILIICKLE